MKDWIAEAVEEIDKGLASTFIVSHIAEIIRRHSPFKDGVAYMPVPRCDGCKFWDESQNYTYDGHRCVVVHVITGPNFGCVQWEAK